MGRGSCSNTDVSNGDDQIRMTLCGRRLARKNQWIFIVTVFGHELAAKRAIFTSDETKKNLRGNDRSSDLRTPLYRSLLYKIQKLRWAGACGCVYNMYYQCTSRGW